MAERINAQIADALTRRDFQVRHGETGLRRDIWAILGILEADLRQAADTATQQAKDIQDNSQAIAGIVPDAPPAS